MSEPEDLKEEVVKDDRQRIRELRHLRGEKLEGEYVSYFSNGQVKTETTYAGNVVNGAFKEYDEEGRLRVSGQYENGIKEGTWFSYDVSGKIVSKEKY